MSGRNERFAIGRTGWLNVDQQIGVKASSIGGVEARVEQESVSGGWRLPGEFEEEASGEHAAEPVSAALFGSECPGTDLSRAFWGSGVGELESECAGEFDWFVVPVTWLDHDDEFIVAGLSIGVSAAGEPRVDCEVIDSDQQFGRFGSDERIGSGQQQVSLVSESVSFGFE